MEILIADPTIKHRYCSNWLWVLMRKIGIGANLLMLANFNADFAYTMDGGPVGGIRIRSLMAASANCKHSKVKNVQPWNSKRYDGLMHLKNRIRILICFTLKKWRSWKNKLAEKVFFNLLGWLAEVERLGMDLIIRDHDRAKFEERKAFMSTRRKRIKWTTRSLNAFCLEFKRILITIWAKIIQKKIWQSWSSRTSDENAGYQANYWKPIRGGDGCVPKISFMRIGQPQNIFAGGETFMVVWIVLPVESMQRATDVIVMKFVL